MVTPPAPFPAGSGPVEEQQEAEWPDYTKASDDDLTLAVRAIGGLARYGNFINATLAGIYAERNRAAASRVPASGEPQ